MLAQKKPEEAADAEPHGLVGIDRSIMEDGVQKSCWGVTAKAVAGFAGLILLAWLIGGTETAAVLAAG